MWDRVYNLLIPQSPPVKTSDVWDWVGPGEVTPHDKAKRLTSKNDPLKGGSQVRVYTYITGVVELYSSFDSRTILELFTNYSNHS